MPDRIGSQGGALRDVFFEGPVNAPASTRRALRTVGIYLHEFAQTPKIKNTEARGKANRWCHSVFLNYWLQLTAANSVPFVEHLRSDSFECSLLKKFHAIPVLVNFSRDFMDNSSAIIPSSHKPGVSIEKREKFTHLSEEELAPFRFESVACRTIGS